MPRANDPGKDNIIMFIEKNTTSQEGEFYEYPCSIARIERRFITTKIRWFRAQYPHHRFKVGDLNNANSIHAFDGFEEESHVERSQFHSRLVDLTRDVLYVLGTPTNQD